MSLQASRQNILQNLTVPQSLGEGGLKTEVRWQSTRVERFAGEIVVFADLNGTASKKKKKKKKKEYSKCIISINLYHEIIQSKLT